MSPMIDTAVDPIIGTLVGRYKVQSELGRGGMGVVYRAHDIRLYRAIALKIFVKAHLAPTAWGLTLTEARLASSLNHPSICTIYDAGEDEGKAYIAMELIEGMTVTKLVMASPASLLQIHRACSEIVSALAHAHERGIVHRDIKSSNVILSTDGHFKILDFGLAKRVLPPIAPFTDSSSRGSLLGKLGCVAGTVQYLAPEILRGERATVRSDLWSLGVLLYQMATGVLPFRGETIYGLTTAIMTSSPMESATKLPAWLAHTIERCLERDPRKRYSCARDIALDLPALVSTPDKWYIRLRHSVMDLPLRIMKVCQ